MPPIDRRTLLSAFAGTCAAHALARTAAPDADNALASRTRRLATAWGEALLRQQIVTPAVPAEHGAFRCPACGFLHGRAPEAVYALLALAQLTGDTRYRDAALRAVAWARNVDAADGAWTNEKDPKSWKGITVFTAISWAHALERHGALLNAAEREQMGTRLRRAGAFIHKTFNYEYGNINYPVTASYGLSLLGKLLNEPEWTARGRELARESLGYLSPNHLLFGEGHPMNYTSPTGCRAVDLGYNVEESLPALLSYARLTGDTAVAEAVRAAYLAHLEFFLPDGAWDNSWGTRSFKWTYWGSRTSDGAYASLLTLAARDPVFHTAAERHLGLLERCTFDGLLYGGPHLRAHGVAPCVHHTLTHIKPLVEALHHCVPDAPHTRAPLPCEAASNVKEWPEIGTFLVTSGAWRATVTRYDALYLAGVWHPTGGALALLHHRDAGTLIAGSLADYVRPEEHNMQVAPDQEDYALTPRVEQFGDFGHRSTLYDLSARLHRASPATPCAIECDTTIRDAKGKEYWDVRLSYRFDNSFVEITAGFRQDASTAVSPQTQVEPPADAPLIEARGRPLGDPRLDDLIYAKLLAETYLVVPILVDPSERVRRVDANTVEIDKRGSTVRLTSATPVELRVERTMRVFNLVPGFAAVPVLVAIGRDKTATLRIQVV